MQQGDFSSYYHHQYPPNPNPNPIPIPNPNPNPNPATDFHSRAYASAPPFNTSCATSDFTDYSQNYPPYSQNPDHTPPTAPSYTPTQPTSTASPPNPNLISSFSPALPPQQPSQFPPYESHVPYHPQPPVTTAQQPQQPLPSYYPPFDQHQTATNYAPPPTNPSPNSPYSSAAYSAPFSRVGGSSSLPPQYDSPYESNPNSMKYDSGVVGGGYFDDKYGGYSRSRSDSGSDLYGKQPESNSFSRYDTGRDDAYGDGVFAYQGGKVEPYGARGTIPKSSASTLFDDYGRPINMSSGKDSHSSSGVSGSGSSKIVRAIPKVEVQQDAKSGVQKFRVKLLAESGGQSTMDVLCQIGLDGIRMLDPNTSRTLRIYPLENITRCELADSSTLAFWSKSSVDIEPRRIRLQSNSYTASTLLDIVTAATVQVKEMGGSTRPSESLKTVEQQLAEKKKGLTDWMNFIKPGNEEKDHWVPDEAVTKCTACGTDFGAFVRKHHCRNCGDIFCDKCTHGRIALTADENAQPVRVCDRCLAEVTQRLSNAKEAANKPAFQSHEDLARKLQDEMEKNRKSSSGSKSDVSGKRMREVACPICTVHLQVQVPSSGSETIECGVCQHPFLVSAH